MTSTTMPTRRGRVLLGDESDMDVHADTLARWKRPPLLLSPSGPRDGPLLLGVRTSDLLRVHDPGAGRAALPRALRQAAGDPEGDRAASSAPSPASARSRVNGVTMTLIAINVGVFLAELAAGGNLGTAPATGSTSAARCSPRACTSRAGSGSCRRTSRPAACTLVGVAHGEWWRLVTAAFLHYGPFHLAVNMYSLYFAGTLLEQVDRPLALRAALPRLGHRRLGGRALSEPRTRSPSARRARSSGSSARSSCSSGAATSRPAARSPALIVLNLIFTFAISNISVGGHIGGLIGGVILMWLLLHTRRSMLQSVGRHRGRDRRELDRRVRQGSRLQLAAHLANHVRTWFEPGSRVSAAGCDVRARAGLGQRGLCRSEPRQRNPERRAGDVVEAE